MNCVQGVYTDKLEGLNIKHQSDKRGILSIGTSTDLEFYITVGPTKSIVVTSDLTLNINKLSVPNWSHWSNFILPTYVSVDEYGTLTKSVNYFYIIITGVCLFNYFL